MPSRWIAAGCVAALAGAGGAIGVAVERGHQSDCDARKTVLTALNDVVTDNHHFRATSKLLTAERKAEEQALYEHDIALIRKAAC